MSPLHMRMNGTLPVRALMMKDNSSKVKVCLFGQNAESNFSIGDVLQVSAVYSKTYQNNMQLPSSPSTKCEVRNKIKICGGPIFVGIHDPQIYILTNVFLYNQTCFPLFKDISMKLRLHNQVKNWPSTKIGAHES